MISRKSILKELPKLIEDEEATFDDFSELIKNWESKKEAITTAIEKITTNFVPKFAIGQVTQFK